MKMYYIDNIQENPTITYNISDLNICYVSENKLFCINEGTCEIYATLSQTTNYLATPSNKIIITVIKNMLIKRGSYKLNN